MAERDRLVPHEKDFTPGFPFFAVCGWGGCPIVFENQYVHRSATSSEASRVGATSPDALHRIALEYELIAG